MQDILTRGAATLLLAILGTTYLLPKIISVVRFKRLMDNPNERSSHKGSVPSLGGMSFYIVLVISLYFNRSMDAFGVSASLNPALAVLFFLGLKDDLVVLAPRIKLIGQFLACGFIVLNPVFQITTLHGFCAISEIPIWLGTLLSLGIMIVIINAFNFIDGIDGLAAAIGIVSFSNFSALFFMAEQNFLALTCLVMVGILIGFLFFNLSTKNKIFMGDTGSMLIGFMLGIMSVRMMTLSSHSLDKLPFDEVNIPVIVVASLIIPLYDTARVFTVRFLQGKSLFAPDRNHLHHLVIDSYEISHAKASFSIAMFNVIWICLISFVIKATNIYVTMLIIVLLLVLLSKYLHHLHSSRTTEVVRLKLGISGIKTKNGNRL